LSEREWEKNPQWERARQNAGLPAKSATPTKATPTKVPAVRQMTDKELLAEVERQAQREGKVRALARVRRRSVRRSRDEYEDQLRYGGPRRAAVARGVRFSEEGAERTTRPLSRGERAMISRQLYQSQPVQSDVSHYPYENWDVDHPVARGRFDRLQERPVTFPRSSLAGKPYLPPAGPLPSQRGFTASPGAVHTAWRPPGQSYLPAYRRALPKRSYLSGRGML
jgi:hypothetical protein